MQVYLAILVIYRPALFARELFSVPFRPSPRDGASSNVSAFVTDLIFGGD